MAEERMETTGSRTAQLSGGRKAWEAVKTVFTWVVMLAAVAMMIFTVLSVSTFDRNDRSLFGYKAFIVRSDSMKATDFDSGDLILLKEVDPATLQAGDIIAFRSIDPNSFGETFTHKIRKLTATEDGEPAFITYGTTTDTDDIYPVTYEQVQGKYRFTLKGVGSFFIFLKTVPGYICCILLPFLLLILIQGVNSIKLFRQYKAEQMAEIEARRTAERAELEAERAAIAEERKRQEEMMQRLLQMQAAMQGETPTNDEE